MKEQNIQVKILKAASAQGDMVWRNNVGKGWVSSNADKAARSGMVYVDRGDVILRQPRWHTWGLIKGASDIIGIRPITVTQDMVGETIGVFLAFEVKTPTGRTLKEQNTFIKNVASKGAIGRIVRSVDDILK